MTRSTNMEHVEVLRHMKETIKAIMPSEVAALDAAIAALSAPQPPAEAQPVGGGEEGFKAWVVEQMPAGTVIDNPAWWADRLARAYALNVPAPPSAPVEVDGHVKALRELRDTGDVSDWRAMEDALDIAIAALAQQPAAVDEVVEPATAPDVARLVEAARNLRRRQRAYLEQPKGERDESKGRLVGDAARELDEALAPFTVSLTAEGEQPEGIRSVTNQLLHWGGIPVYVTGTVTTSPGNWSLIDAALSAQPGGRSDD